MQKRKSYPSLVYGIPISILLVLGLRIIWNPWADEKELEYGQFLHLLDTPTVVWQDVVVRDAEIQGKIRFQQADPHVPTGLELNKTYPFVVTRPPGNEDFSLFDRLKKSLPTFQVKRGRSTFGWIISILYFVVAALAVVALFLYFGLGNRSLAFGKSRHRVFSRASTITFKDVAGIDEAKHELSQVVDFLKNRDRYTRLGARIPRGVLLVGPPGTGKTLLALSVAGEADVPFLSISGSEFVEMYVGVGASRVRDLFRDAGRQAPCIVFIDELDALGRSRGGAAHTAHQEREQTLNQLLVEMDGFDANQGIFIIAATNRPEVLDTALLRPGRFDRTVVVDRPDVDGREQILQVHTQKIQLDSSVNLRKVANLTPGLAGADLANIVNEAALLAAKRNANSVTMTDMNEAIERGAIGLERKSRIMLFEEKQRIAVHEAGHALVACALPDSDLVHKVSIIPRGLAGGYVLQRPENDRLIIRQKELEARIQVALGGTIAEELTFQELSSGATADLQHATQLAEQMVREYGMSKLGRIYYAAPGTRFLESTPESGPQLSEATLREIDMEIRRILQDALEQVRTLLETSHETLTLVTERLITKEVLEDKELFELLYGSGFPLSDKVRTRMQLSGMLKQVDNV